MNFRTLLLPLLVILFFVHLPIFLLFFILFLLFGVRSSVLVVLLNLRIVLDKIFDNFDEAFLEQWVIMLNPLREIIVFLNGFGLSLVALFLEEEGGKVKNFLQKRSGFDC